VRELLTLQHTRKKIQIRMPSLSMSRLLWLIHTEMRYRLVKVNN
jgi:hypothetical protein